MTSFESFLNRQAAEIDLKDRAKIASLRQWLDDAPPLYPLKHKAIEQESQAVFGQKIDTFRQSTNLTDIAPNIDFIWLTTAAMQALEARQVRQAKLKLSLPFAIDIDEITEYEITKIRAIGGDCLVIPAQSNTNSIARNQLAIEICRELGLESILKCQNEAELSSNIERDCDWFLVPNSLAREKMSLLKGRWVIVTQFQESDLAHLAEYPNLAIIVNG